ncbi:hypothetical protein N324_02506, partial [Chlamydotis macqueenii]
VTVPVGTIVGSSVIWNDIFYCKNTELLARNLINTIPMCLEA